MKQIIVLFIKEVKNMYRELLAVLAAQAGFLVYARLFLVNHGNYFTPFERYVMDIMTFSLYLYPAVLVYSLYIESQTGTTYQSLTLPVRRMLLGGKFAVVLSAFTINGVMLSVYSFVMYKLGLAHAEPDVIYTGVFAALSMPFISLCLVSAVWGIMQVVRRNRLVLALVVSVVGFGIYMYVLGFHRQYYPSVRAELVYHVASTLITGGVFALVGFVFYERFVEV